MRWNNRVMMARRTLLIGAPAMVLAGMRAFAADTDTTAAAVADAAGAFLAANPQAVGLSIGMLRGDTAYDAHFGTVTRGGGRRPDSRTIYPIASISKTFTAA